MRFCRFSIFSKLLWGILCALSALSAADAAVTQCSFKGISLHGKVQAADSFADFKVQFVSSFPDLKIKFADSFPGIP